MSDVHRTYGEVHIDMRRSYGRASEFSCVSCSAPAGHWCYQYTAGDSELTSPEGHPYSENPADYAPMCRSCHKKFDVSMDPRQRDVLRRNGLKAAARNNLRAAEDPEWASERARRLNAAIRKRAAEDPEYAAQHRATKQRAAASGGMTGRRYCLGEGCGLVSIPTGLANHQRATGHTGYFDEITDSHPVLARYP